MKKALPLGVMDYEKLISENYYAVDKTLIIQEFLERQSGVTLITRPRRFGKTLNMSLLANFFDITKDSNNLFKNTAIMNTEYANEMNTYPTIFISFAGAKGEKSRLVKAIKRILREEYNRYEFIFENLSKLEMSDYDECITAITSNEENLNGIDDSISFLMKMLEKYYHRKVMLFIDEYDTPFIEAHVNGFYEEIKDGLAAMLHNSLKLSSSLQYACITGIQRVAKENIFSDLNNLIVCTVNDTRYAKHFGFTKEETSALLEYYGLELNADVKDMYDGYRIGNIDMYNPWSIINYADNKRLIPYWVNTGSNGMIKSAMKKCDGSFGKEYEQLIREGTLSAKINLATSFFEQSSTASLWGLFVNAGYLTISDTISDRDSRYTVRVPNYEVNTEFISLTESYLEINENGLSNLFEHLKELEMEAFLEDYRNILQLPSYHDLHSENSYHMMMLGMSVCLSYDYEVISNREMGMGRCDLILRSLKENKPSFVIEFKYLKKDIENETSTKEKLKELSKDAMRQIKEKKYDKGINGKVICIGLAHCSKYVEMSWQEHLNN